MFTATVVIYSMLAILLLAVVSIVIMLLSIAKAGDERRKQIVIKACSNSFLLLVGILVISFIENLVRVFVLRSGIHEINPFTILVVTALIYAVQLMYFKRKYGG